MCFVRDTWMSVQTCETPMKTKMGECCSLKNPQVWIFSFSLLQLFFFFFFSFGSMRRDELAAISGPNEFAEFYNRLKHIKEFHRKHPNEVQNPEL